MYEELVKTLRLRADLWEKMYDEDTVLKQAADVIEGLSRDLDSMNEANTALYGALPKWIPVTERLPEDDGQVLAYYGFDRGDGYLGMMFMQVLDYYAHDPKPHFQHESMGVTVTHWQPLPEPPKEET